MRYRRITAAIFDIIILCFIAAFIFAIMPLNAKIENNYREILQIEAKIKNNVKLTDEEQDRIDTLLYENEREFVKYYLVFSLVLIIYFILIPYKFKDQTPGQKLRNVRVVSEGKITIDTYVIRAILNSGLFLTIFFPLFVYILNAFWYSIFASILYLIQIFYWVVSLFTLIITKRTIHDKITKTQVIEVKR